MLIVLLAKRSHSSECAADILKPFSAASHDARDIETLEWCVQKLSWVLTNMIEKLLQNVLCAFVVLSYVGCTSIFSEVYMSERFQRQTVNLDFLSLISRQHYVINVS